MHTVGGRRPTRTVRFFHPNKLNLLYWVGGMYPLAIVWRFAVYSGGAPGIFYSTSWWCWLFSSCGFVEWRLQGALVGSSSSVQERGLLTVGCQWKHAFSISGVLQPNAQGSRRRRGVGVDVHGRNLAFRGGNGRIFWSRQLTFHPSFKIPFDSPSKLPDVRTQWGLSLRHLVMCYCGSTAHPSVPEQKAHARKIIESKLAIHLGPFGTMPCSIRELTHPKPQVGICFPVVWHSACPDLKLSVQIGFALNSAPAYARCTQGFGCAWEVINSCD